MYETTQELDDLQALLDRSYARAGSHLLSIHTPSWRMSAQDLSETLVKVCVMDLATVGGQGNPIVAPVDGLFLHGKFWFGSGNNSLRFRHIRNNPQVSAAHTRGEELSIIVHGKAQEIDVSTGEHGDLRKYCREIYPDYDNWGMWGKQPYAYIHATSLFAIRIVLPD